MEQAQILDAHEGPGASSMRRWAVKHDSWFLSRVLSTPKEAGASFAEALLQVSFSRQLFNSSVCLSFSGCFRISNIHTKWRRVRPPSVHPESHVDIDALLVLS